MKTILTIVLTAVFSVAWAQSNSAIIHTEQMQQAVERGAIIWDVRGEKSYLEGHLPGAINIGEFGLTLLASVGDFLVKLGQMFIQYAIASAGFQAALKTPGAWPIALAAGIALVAIGTAISNVSKKGLAGAGGGGSSSGGGGSASGYSPAMGGSSAMGGNVQFEIQGASLVGVLSNNERKNKNYK